MTDLTAVERIAIAGAFKGKQLEKDKATLVEGCSHDVDITVRLKGSVQKAKGTPGGSWSVQPTVNLRSWPVLCAMFKLLGIGAKRLAKAAADVKVDATADTELEAIIVAEESARAAKLPALTGTSAGTAGAVQSQVLTTKIETPKAE